MATQHILLTENRLNLQHSLGLMLKQADYRVSLAENTEAAVALLKTLACTRDPVDLLIVDLDSASPEACAAFMHALSGSALAIPYLILAEDIRETTGDALKKHGCLACITKPFEPATLLRSVQEALDRRQQQDGHQPGRKPEIPSTECPTNQPG